MKSECKVCKQFLEKRYSHISSNGRNAICVDSLGRQWVGRICPSCHKDRVAQKRVKPKTHNCKTCNKDFSKTGTHQMYCSVECRPKKIYKYTRAPYVPRPPRIKSCSNCLVSFETRTRSRYCSPICRKNFLGKKKIIRKSCERCGKEFQATRKSMRFCSTACQRPPKVLHNCLQCSKATPRPKYCSKSCMKKHRRTLGKIPPIDREALRKYKKVARKRRKLKERNQRPGWANHKTLVTIYNDRPEGMHVDHIIPLNHPNVCGLHCPDNLQYLSESDNVTKSNQFDGTYENLGWKKAG